MSPTRNSPCLTIPFHVYFIREPNRFNTLAAQLYCSSGSPVSSGAKMFNIWETWTQKHSKFLFHRGGGGHTGDTVFVNDGVGTPKVSVSLPKQEAHVACAAANALNCFELQPTRLQRPFSNAPISFSFSKYLPPLLFLHYKMLNSGKQ